MQRIILLFLFTGSFLIVYNVNAQRGNYRVMFYNVENFFDTVDDTLTADEEFLPESNRHWNDHNFYTKLNNIFKVIVAVGGWEPPEVIGLCEVENEFVLKKLIYDTPLLKYEYKMVHRESPDRRGIDVAIIYRKDKLKKLEEGFIPVNFPENPNHKTREIVYMKALTLEGDTLHFFVNHWPSRYGGAEVSEPFRMVAAHTLRKKTDSLLVLNRNARIIIMGDFNDDPADRSLTSGLEADISSDSIVNNRLYNLTSCINTTNVPGSLKYRGQWSRFDQLIISGALLAPGNSLSTGCKHAYIFDDKFLLEYDNEYMGYKPFRSFKGYRYQQGYSDHLPVYLDLF
jgi:hypothetical protein